jgi:hypothetical protein
LAHADVTTPGSPRIDWRRGLLLARAGAPADLRTPSARVARVGSERRARESARSALATAALTVPLASGTPLAGALSADPAARARLDRAIARALDVSVDWSTDGSTMVTAGLPLEAIRLALTGPPAPPVAADTAPTALVIDARALAPKPALGWTLSAGAERYAGPTIFHTDAAEADADPRLGPRPRKGTASKAAAGVIELVDFTDLAAARKAGALVVILLPSSK